MDINLDHNSIEFKASEMFNKHIPFKIYALSNDKFSGTTIHTHDYMQIWYVINGNFDHCINNAINPLTRGNLFVLPPFVEHKININYLEDVKIIGCEFLASFINENISWIGDSSSLFDFAYLEPFLVSYEAIKPRLHLSGKNQFKVEELLMDMLHEYEQENKYYEINIKADLLKLLAIIAREYEIKCDSKDLVMFEKYRDAVKSAIDYIDNHYTNNIYIDDVCKIAMMSQTYFSYIFKQITDKTFVEYINSLRILKAIDMLKDSSSSMTDICFNTGFNDTTYFNKVFRKETGLSPSQYRKLK